MPKFYKICIIVITVVYLCPPCLTTNADGINRIVGGVTTTISSANYLVSLRDKSNLTFCAGSLVERRYVVTAAHCIERMQVSDIVVHGGATYLNEEGVAREVVLIFKPKDFNMNTLMNDVAVLKLNSSMNDKNIGIVPLCTQKLFANSWVRVFGWGLQEEDGTEQSIQLKLADIRVVSFGKCVKSYSSVLNIRNSMFCASLPGLRDSCVGDSGGPLEYRGQLCGIVSFGVGCARLNYPGVYTSINAVRRFIKRVIEKENNMTVLKKKHDSF